MIVIVMKFLNKIKDKILENYHSKSFTKWLVFFLCVLVPLCFFSRFMYLNKELLSWQNGWWAIVLILIIAIIFVCLLLKWIIGFIFLSSYKIEDNMEKLPQNVWSEKLLVQYSLPKDITPSEVGIMMSGKAEITNLICIIYKWINEWLVKIVNENGVKYIEVIDDLWKKVCEYDGNVWLNGGIVKVTGEADKRYIKAIDDELWKKLPEYEYYLFYKLFAWAWYRVKLKKIEKFRLKVNDMIIKSCVEKWYLETKSWHFPNSERIVSLDGSIWCASIVCIYLGVMFLSFGSWLWYGLFALATLFLLWSRWHIVYYVKSTKKWDKLRADIYWYKYYLEHCEEEQINSDLEDGEIYSKHLPYAIALKLNRKIIDELS